MGLKGGVIDIDNLVYSTHIASLCKSNDVRLSFMFLDNCLLTGEMYGAMPSTSEVLTTAARVKTDYIVLLLVLSLSKKVHHGLMHSDHHCPCMVNDRPCRAELARGCLLVALYACRAVTSCTIGPLAS